MIWMRLAIGVLVLSAAVDAAPGPVAEAETETSAARRAHNDVHLPWLADLAEHLARSSNPRHLMVAARLATGFHFEPDVEVSPQVRALLDSRPKLDAGALVEDALRLGETDPLVWWVAANDCPAPAPRCDRIAAISRLQSLAPSNAAVWMLSDRIRRLTEKDQVDAVHDAGDDMQLERIAAASRFDIYYGEALRSYIDAFSQLPLPAFPDMMDAQFDERPIEDVVRGMLAFGYAAAEALPGLAYFSGLCDEHAIARLGEPRRELCIGAMRTAAREADSVLIERLASRTLLRLLPPGSERDATLRASLRSAWQMESWMALMAPHDPERPLGKTEFEEETIALWRSPGATELDVLRQQLEAAGIPPDPPVDWKPSQPFDPLQSARAD
jgi:hypothetical protein